MRACTQPRDSRGRFIRRQVELQPSPSYVCVAIGSDRVIAPEIPRQRYHRRLSPAALSFTIWLVVVLASCAYVARL